MLNLWHAYIRAAQVGWDANVVVAMRLMRLTVGGALAQREAQRMVAEKVAAIAEAQAAAITKMIMGGGMAAATKSASAVNSGRCGQTDVALLDADFVRHQGVLHRIVRVNVGFWERSGNLVLDQSTTGFGPKRTLNGWDDSLSS